MSNLGGVFCCFFEYFATQCQQSPRAFRGFETLFFKGWLFCSFTCCLTGEVYLRSPDQRNLFYNTSTKGFKQRIKRRKAIGNQLTFSVTSTCHNTL